MVIKVGVWRKHSMDFRLAMLQELSKQQQKERQEKAKMTRSLRAISKKGLAVMS